MDKPLKTGNKEPGKPDNPLKGNQNDNQPSFPLSRLRVGKMSSFKDIRRLIKGIIEIVKSSRLTEGERDSARILLQSVNLYATVKKTDELDQIHKAIERLEDKANGGKPDGIQKLTA